jgi:S-adenosylmethionine decarboxylase
MVDCFQCGADKLTNPAAITAVLDEFPDKIGMTKISPPYVFRCDGGGLSGVVLIAESHITIHTFPGEQQAFIDIFSCRDFNLSFAVEYLTNYFEAKRHEVKIPTQKMPFPSNSRMASNIISEVQKTPFSTQRLYH